MFSNFFNVFWQGTKIEQSVFTQINRLVQTHSHIYFDSHTQISRFGKSFHDLIVISYFFFVSFFFLLFFSNSRWDMCVQKDVLIELWKISRFLFLSVRSETMNWTQRSAWKSDKNFNVFTVLPLNRQIKNCCIQQFASYPFERKGGWKRRKIARDSNQFWRGRDAQAGGKESVKCCVSLC